MDSILHHLLRIITRHLQFCWQSICRGKWTALSLYMQKMPIPSFLLPVSPYDWLARLKLRSLGGFQEFLPELSGSFLHRINHGFLHLPFERKNKYLPNIWRFSFSVNLGKHSPKCSSTLFFWLYFPGMLVKISCCNSIANYIFSRDWLELPNDCLKKCGFSCSVSSKYCYFLPSSDSQGKFPDRIFVADL